jgi:hypothetical protein
MSITSTDVAKIAICNFSRIGQKRELGELARKNLIIIFALKVDNFFYQERQRAEGRRQKEYCFLHSATTGGSKGLRPPLKRSSVAPIKEGSESPS